MGVLTDFFVASNDELNGAFRGWAKPAPLLDEFVTETVKNPFTGAMETTRTRISRQKPAPSGDAVDNGEYDHLPWIDQKGIYAEDVVLLAEVLMNWDRDNATSEIYGRMHVGPPSTEVTLWELPPLLVARLAALSSEQCSIVGASWASKRRTEQIRILNDEVGVASTQERAELERERELDRPDSEWAEWAIERLSDLSKLARVATESRRAMFMWMSP